MSAWFRSTGPSDFQFAQARKRRPRGPGIRTSTFGKLFLAVVCALVVTAGAASATVPEIETAPVTVTVISAGQPAPNVRLHLFGAEGGYRFKRNVTDENGQAEFILPVGRNYKVRASVAHRQYWSDAFQVAPQGNQVTVDAGGGVLEVTLEKSAGNPLAGVDLYLFNTRGCYKKQKQTTDADGKASFTVPSGAYRLRADYLGYQFWSDATQVDSNTAVTFTIPHKTVTLTVNSVVDASEPIEGARITLYTAKGRWKCWGWRHNHKHKAHDLGLSQYSDANGQVTFDLPDRSYRFRADYLNYAFWSRPFRSADAVLNIASGEAELTVVREGMPLANIPVSLFTAAGEDTGILRHTGADGKILFRLPAKAWQFKADYLSHAYWTPHIRLRRGKRIPIELSVGDDILAFNLTLQKNDQKPLEGIGCYVYDVDNSYTGVNGATDSKGRVRFDLREGQYKIRVDYLGYQFWSEVYDLSTTMDDVLTIPHKDIQITVNGVFDTPQPLEGLDVRIFTAADQDVFLNAATGADGTAIFSLPDKPYMARVNYLGKAYVSDPFTGQDAVVGIALGEADITVTGAGQGIPGARVHAFSEAGEDLNLSKVSDAAGLVQFRLPVGTYKFSTDWLGYTFWSQAVTLTAGNVHPLDLNTGGGSFILTLLKNETEPLTNVKCELFDGDAGQYLDVWADTDDNGQVTFDLVDGSFTIRIDLPGYPLFTDAFQVPDELSKTITIAHTDVPVTINEIHADAVPLQGVAVHLFHPDGTSLNRLLTTDDNGQVIFSLPQKAYKVRADYMGYQFWSPLFNSQPVTVNIPGANADVTVTGAGRPLEGVEVAIFSPGGTYLGLNDHTDDQGRTLFPLPAKSYKFQADYQGAHFWSDAVTLSAGRRNPVTIDTGGGTFTLRVQKDDYHPLAGLECYVYLADDSNPGISGTTDTQGRVVFSLADGQYKFKVKYLGHDVWSEGLTVPDTLAHTLEIDHRRFHIMIQGLNPGPVPLPGLQTDLYTGAGAAVGLSADTDADGLAVFDLPERDYKVQVAHNGQTYWSGILQPQGNLIAINQGGDALLPAVTDLSAALNNSGQIDLSWTAPADTGGIVLAGYNLYRRHLCESAFIKVNLDPIDAGATAYTDTTAAGPGTYAYYIAALSDADVQGYPSNIAAAGFGGTLSQENTAAVTNLTATWNQGKAQLSWDVVPGLSYQVYRGSDPAALAPWQRTGTAPYIDDSANPYQTWYYQVATVKRLCDPVSGQPVDNIGPLSALITLAELSAPTVTTDGLQLNAEGDYVIVSGSSGGYTLSGSYSGFSGDVIVTATLGDQTITITASGGTFSIDLPHAGDWTITIGEADGWQQTEIGVEWSIDDQPPSLTIDGPSSRSTTDTMIRITGLAADAQSDLQGVTIGSDRYPGMSFGASVGAMGDFSGEVPLKVGDNILTVSAADVHGNGTAATITVTQALTALPVVHIVAPADGATVTTSRVNVVGTVRSALPPEQIRLVLGDHIIFPGGSDNAYTFTFEKIDLAAGSNILQVRAETTYGNVTAQTTVMFADTPDDQKQPPQISILSPLPGSYLAESPVVSGLVTGQAAIAAVTVNGQPAQTTGLGTPNVSFQAAVAFPAGQSEAGISVSATDTDSQSATVSLVVYLDDTPPAISLAETSLQPPPAVNTVTESPYIVAGSVTEANLAGLFINDQHVSLTPSGAGDTFDFSAGLALTYDQQQHIVLSAWDLAGNRTSTEFIVSLDSNLAIEVIEPADGARLQGQGGAMDVAVTVRIAGAAADDVFSAAIDDGAPVTLARSGPVGKAGLSVPLDRDDHKLAIAVQNSAGNSIARTTTHFSTRNMDNVSLSVERQSPANGATGIEPNDFIALYFNKAIDPALLSIEVLETAHGQTYASPPAGADMTGLNAIELVEVHRDRESVPGGISYLPGNRMAAFYPKRDLAYGAGVFITVTYDGAEVARSTYRIRELPTLIEGFVTDSVANPVAGIAVALPELGLTATTNADGAYSFGFGMNFDQTIPDGRHRLVVNPAMQNRAYGTVDQWVRVRQGRLNSGPVAKLPVISETIPFRRIISGRADNLLADGALQLNLSQAELTFPDLRDQGDVHAQFLSVENLPYAPLSFATPLWIFCLQPGAVGVSGQVGLTLAMPRRTGSYAYLDDFGQRVALVGLDPEALMIVPVGVGRIDADAKTVVSQGPVHLHRLDMIGYVLIGAQGQPLLEQYVNGDINLQQMIAGLENGT